MKTLLFTTLRRSAVQNGLLFLLFGGIILSFGSASAQDLQLLENDQPITSIGGLMDLGNRAIRIAAILAAPVAVITMIVGGYQYVTSQGNPEGVAKAKTVILYGIIGTILVISSFTITSFVNNLLADDAHELEGQSLDQFEGS